MSNTYKILKSVLSGSTLNTINNTYECFKAVYSEEDTALRINIEGGITSEVKSTDGLMTFTNGVLTDYQTEFEVKFIETNGLEGVEITIGSETIYTDENGEATINLTNGDYTASIRLTGYDTTSETFEVDYAAQEIGFTMVETSYLIVNSVDDVCEMSGVTVGNQTIQISEVRVQGSLTEFDMTSDGSSIFSVGDWVMIGGKQGAPSLIKQITEIDTREGYIIYVENGTTGWTRISKLTEVPTIIPSGLNIAITQSTTSSYDFNTDITAYYSLGTKFMVIVTGGATYYDIATSVVFDKGVTQIRAATPLINANFVSVFTLPS